MPDVYSYDELPGPLRVQIVHIIDDSFGEDAYGGQEAHKAYQLVHDALCREYGVFELIKRVASKKDGVLNFFLGEESIERALDVVEICFKAVNTFIRSERYAFSTMRRLGPDDAIAELNARFKENGVGFRFESNEIVRVDSELLHSEAVKPTLSLLRNKGFEGANDEFLSAHEHYRHGQYKECIVDTLKSFESTMKVICKKRGWPVQAADTAKGLIAVCFARGLLPPYLESQFSSLRSLLESGVPTIRNKVGGHGQGAEIVIVPEYIASYALHLTASTILFLVQAETANL